MLKNLLFLFSVIGLLSTSVSANALDLSKLGNALQNGTVENILNGVISSSNIEVKDLVGTWNYNAPAIEFESDDMLKDAGGIAVTTSIEQKLAPYYTKAGLNNSSIIFTTEGKFTMKFKKGSIKGSVTKSGYNFIFHFNGISQAKGFDVKAYIKKGTALEITFDASKLVTLINTISSVTGNATVSSAVKLLNSYEGVYAGFEYKK